MGRRTPGRETSLIFFLNIFLRNNVILGLQTSFFDGFDVLMSFLAENDAERFRNYFKKLVLDKTNKIRPNPKLHSDMSGRSAGSWGTVEV